ncbi:hypothetical protein B0T16DRAFT_461858 [Cercophora newfieldiana]|uniref:Uncharacterized protein n=1 Tax=Cercophora newfieldiana TaxID=92897 RepID=A0AA39XXD5_9PEZI|nr:hypothetical protein B0T16DRAFT_461858 [Cercophora newfieldiana]
MGAYVSIPDCKSHYNITVNCDYFVTNLTNGEKPKIGGYGRREIPPDADVAGIGVVSSFLATTSLALLLSIISIFWLMGKRIWGEKDPNKHRKKRKRHCDLSLSELCEALVLSCSDTQIFTGGAYAMTLRYFKGCSIIAYHYDIVANLMLLTCATHLMSITIVRNYWQWPWLGILRTLICTGVFIVTGILLANQNSASDFPFPSVIPAASNDTDMILMPAACFQQGNSQLLGTLKDSLGEKAAEAILFSTPGNRIPGWNNYLIILLLYLCAGFVDILRTIRRGALSNPNGKRGRFVAWLKSLGRSSKDRDPNPPRRSTWRGTLVFSCFCAYLLGGIGVSCWTVFQSANYIFSLRSWAKASGWLKLESGNQSAEDDATSFGQLVPIFTNVILLFTIAQMMSKACWKFTDRKFDMYGGVIYQHGKDDDSIVMGDRPTSPSKSHVGVQVHQYSAVPTTTHATDSSDIQPISLSAPAPAPAMASAPAPAPAATTVSAPSSVPSGRWENGRWSSTGIHPTSDSPTPPNRWQNSPTPPSILEQSLHSVPTPPLQPQHSRTWSSSQQMAHHTTGSWAALQQPEMFASHPQPHRVSSFPSYAEAPTSQPAMSEHHRVASYPGYAEAPAPLPAVSEYYPTAQPSSVNLGTNAGSTSSFPAQGQQPIVGPDGRQWQFVPVMAPP